ncbi:hypothetical protein ED733_000630 [Metarhizium rileyi]|uniref:Uncharacterized protein n=1 Tax=Metarhizium rileyi (strain RCEF 4871) TaxID=1649241 RepID=A0A5C6G1E6_METRR|nr:hypothetical protein ED733_000630 [Metarhizium rileyi]
MGEDLQTLFELARMCLNAPSLQSHFGKNENIHIQQTPITRRDRIVVLPTTSNRDFYSRQSFSKSDSLQLLEAFSSTSFSLASENSSSTRGVVAADAISGDTDLTDQVSGRLTPSRDRSAATRPVDSDGFGLRRCLLELPMSSCLDAGRLLLVVSTLMGLSGSWLRSHFRHFPALHLFSGHLCKRPLNMAWMFSDVSAMRGESSVRTHRPKSLGSHVSSAWGSQVVNMSN